MRNLILALGLSSALFIAACGKKEEPAPPIEPTAPVEAAPAPEAVAPDTTEEAVSSAEEVAPAVE